MKRLLQIIVLSGVIVPLSMRAQIEREAVNKTTFRPHEVFTYTSPERTSQFSPLWAKRYHDNCHAAFQIVPFYTKSTNHCELATYFLPFGKSAMVAGELQSEAVINRTVDVIANYFDVQSAPVNQDFASFAALTFQSNLRFKAHQSILGIGFDFVKHVTDDWWVELAFPVVRVNNHFIMHEEVTNKGNSPDGGISGTYQNVPQGAYGSMTQALKSDYFKYGKIDNKCCPVWGVADVELSLGGDWLNNETTLANTALGFIIPTGTKPDPRRVFSPIIGNARHAGIFLNSHAEMIAAQRDDYTITVKVNAATKYSFKNTQCRSLDLVGKPWGRYIWVYPNEQAARKVIDQYPVPSGAIIHDGLIQPAINFLTQRVEVKPRCTFDYQAAFEFDRCNMHAEVGFNGHFRQAEQICLKSPWQEGPGIVDVRALAGIQKNYTNAYPIVTAPTKSYSLINAESNGIDTDTNNDGDYMYVPIKTRDLDLNAASHPALFTRTFFGSIGYHSDEYADREYFVNLGGAYEFSYGNVALERWTAWLKGGVSF
jgi:hypothetical protein